MIICDKIQDIKIAKRFPRSQERIFKIFVHTRSSATLFPIPLIKLVTSNVHQSMLVIALYECVDIVISNLSHAHGSR